MNDYIKIIYLLEWEKIKSYGWGFCGLFHWSTGPILTLSQQDWPKTLFTFDNILNNKNALLFHQN